MPPFSSQSALPLPRGWRKITRAGVLHAISIASTAMISAWGRAASSRSSRTGLPRRMLAPRRLIPRQAVGSAGPVFGPYALRSPQPATSNALASAPGLT